MEFVEDFDEELYGPVNLPFMDLLSEYLLSFSNSFDITKRKTIKHILLERLVGEEGSQKV